MDGSEHFHGDPLLQHMKNSPDKCSFLVDKCNPEEAELSRTQIASSEHQALVEKCNQQEADLARARKNLVFAAQVNDGKLAAIEAQLDSVKASEEQEAALREHLQIECAGLKSRMEEVESEKTGLVAQLELAKSDASLLRIQLAEIQCTLAASKQELKHSGTNESISSLSTRPSEGSISLNSSHVGSFWRSPPARSNLEHKRRVCCDSQMPWIEAAWCGPRSKRPDKVYDPIGSWDLSLADEREPMESPETPHLWSQEWWKTPCTKDDVSDVAWRSESAAAAYRLFTAWSRKGGS